MPIPFRPAVRLGPALAFALIAMAGLTLPAAAAPESGDPPSQYASDVPSGGGEDAFTGADSADEAAPEEDFTRPDPDQPRPEIIYDASRLPEPVQRMRRLIIEACRSGDLEKLRPLIGTGDSATQISFGEVGGDPIEFLRESSGDGEGLEIMAILLEVMQSGFVRLNPDTPEELYVWPYFFAIPLKDLTREQKVELFTIVTAGDYEEMKTYGAYVFYRSAITPDGRWLFFVAGD